MTKVTILFDTYPHLSYFLATLSNTVAFRATLISNPILLILKLKDLDKEALAKMAASTGAIQIDYEDI